MNYDQRFGRALRLFREARGLSQQQTASQANVSGSHLSRVELGDHPSDELVGRLCRVYGVQWQLVRALADGGEYAAKTIFRALRRSWDDTPIRELDTVSLKRDFPSFGLLAGATGAVVHAYSPVLFEVEFVRPHDSVTIQVAGDAISLVEICPTCEDQGQHGPVLEVNGHLVTVCPDCGKPC